MASKNLQSTIEIAGTLSPSLQQAISEAVSKLEEMSKETLESVGASQKLVAEISTQENVLKRLQQGYADYIVEGKENSQEAQSLANKIQEVSNELSENKDVLEKAERAAKGLTETNKETANTYEKLQQKIDEQDSTLSQLKKQYSNVVLEQGETSEEAEILANRIQNLSRMLRENREKIDNAERAAEQFGNSLEEAGESAEDSAEGYTILNNIIANLITDAIENATEAFKELATEGDNAMAMLESKTGASSKIMEKYKDVLYNVYNDNYGESLEDVSESLSTVIQMTNNLDKSSLENVTKNAMTLEKVFGFDTMESMRAVNGLMNQFGVTSDEAFNLIVQGAQNGLNQNDDLLDTINEYSVQFKNAGYSAEDMFNMIANGVEEGTWSVDKLGDAVGEFNKKMRDGSANDYIKQLGLNTKDIIKQFNSGGEDAQKAINSIMKSLGKVDDVTKQNIIGVGLFGTMWEDLQGDAVDSLMNTEGAIKSTNKAMEQVDSAAYDTLGSSMQQLGRTIKAEVVQPIVEKLKPEIKDTINFINSNVKPAVQWLINNLPLIGLILADLGAIMAYLNWGSIVGKVTSMGKAISGVMTALTATPILALIAVITALVAAFMYLWETNEEFRANILKIWDGIKQKFQDFSQGIVDRLNALGFEFEDITEVISALWNGFCELLIPVFEGVFNHISDVITMVLGVITGVLDVFIGIFTGNWSQAWDGVKGIFSSIWNYIVSSLQNYLNVFIGLIDTVLGWCGTSWENVWNTICSFVSTAWETIKNVVQVGLMFIGSLISAAFQIITLPFRFIWENCKETVLSVWEKIHSIISSVLNKITSVIGGAWSAISSIASEKWSAITSIIGSKISAAKEKVSSVIGGMKSSVSSNLGGILNTVKTIFGNIVSSITSKMQAAKDAVGNAIKALKSKFNFSWSLPKLKLPHFDISGKFSLNPPSVPKFNISWYKDGGILTKPTVFGTAGNTLLAGGEAGAEAVLPLKLLWEQLDRILHNAFSANAESQEFEDNSLTQTAGRLLTLDDFSLGSLANETNITIYYDFSGFEWSPQINNGSNESSDDILTKLKAHEAEFFDWLEEFIQMREVAQYA